ncbi:electron transfer flavoprotein FAD-binding domain protein [Lentilactobacillus senioris DSM 24302 = JCM 17472]|uniref:Electron transfer flavoprotein FAD-binding domain protein n=1 Tax=Lentilactobacillus senioris DSM 24302 = JCM 17472 TaxID=1423802 RepID=A0A0R2CRQ0_9LACO|nr:electron transfer flavoprotein subunit alpha/FixB family protein [Lentilactobacillus senioris]KRM94376.1 electron transfer flavoprotein FAD-binding domain protein [Lentilactobacillus senioris DSM 24302 = JCM 17472]
MDNQEIWVYIQLNGSKIEPTSLQLLTKAKSISNQKSVVAVLPEATNFDAETTVSQYGPDKIITIKDDRFVNATDAEIADALFQITPDVRPNSFLFPATVVGRSVAPRLQAKLQTGLTADCLDLFFEDDLLIQAKPTYGDNIMCDIICPDSRPQMATVRPNTFNAQLDSTKIPEIINAEFTFHPETQMTVTETVPMINSSANISDANIVIALGRGANNPKTIELAHQLADQLGGMVGVTRPMTDNPEFGHELQIGQSGHTIAPKLLINLGISGAVQYIVGIKNAKQVVSVNTDPDAPIFAESDYGYVGDATEFLTALLAKTK